MFQASSAMRAFWAAVSAVNGGNGGRDMATPGCWGAASGGRREDQAASVVTTGKSISVLATSLT